ncbi:MAG: mechanosensitive ion channel [Ruminococcaceae bacterium]|nr:mechanosensitive ion channel [Oscillospiraceae bacterium]
MKIFERFFNREFLDSATGTLISAGIKLLIAGFFLFLGLRVIKFILKRIEKSKLYRKMDNSVKSFTISFLSIAFKAILLITVAAYLGVPMSSMVALVASAGVAIGLALQGGLSNIASGIMIIIFRPFSVGNYIECSGYSGSVISIGIFHTTLATPDNKNVVIPNSVLTSQTLVNYSAEKYRRVDLDFSAAYNCDADKVKDVLLSCANAIPQVIKDNSEKPIDTMIMEYAPSGITYRVRMWCESADYWTIAFRMREDVKRAFNENGIEIPYNKLDINVINTKD